MVAIEAVNFSLAPVDKRSMNDHIYMLQMTDCFFSRRNATISERSRQIVDGCAQWPSCLDRLPIVHHLHSTDTQQTHLLCWPAQISHKDPLQRFHFLNTTSRVMPLPSSPQYTLTSANMSKVFTWA
jgi:hypothetical protein